MKAYLLPNQLRLVGKAYEIRYYLRAWSKRADNPHQPLSGLLAQTALSSRSTSR